VIFKFAFDVIFRKSNTMPAYKEGYFVWLKGTPPFHTAKRTTVLESLRKITNKRMSATGDMIF